MTPAYPRRKNGRTTQRGVLVAWRRLFLQRVCHSPKCRSFIAFVAVTRYKSASQLTVEIEMAVPAERMRMMRERRRKQGLRELRLVIPDPRSRSVRRRVAAQVAQLIRNEEDEALSWIEAVSEFDTPGHQVRHETR